MHQYNFPRLKMQGSPSVFRPKSVPVSSGNRCTNCVAHRAEGLRSQSASSTAAGTPSLLKLLSVDPGTHWL